MRSLIRNYLFSPLRKSRDACGVCGPFGTYFEVVDGERADGQPFPGAFYRLQIPQEGLSIQYSGEELRVCPDCGGFLAYQEWTPGGSEDAMQTYVHESVNPIGFLEAYLLHQESEAVVEANVRRDPKLWKEAYDRHQKGGQDLLNNLRAHAQEILQEGVEMLGRRGAQQMQVYQKEAQEAEGETARALGWVLTWELGQLVPEDLKGLLPMLEDDRPGVSAALSEGLVQGLEKWRGDPRLQEFAKTLQEGNPSHKLLLQAMEKIQNPRKWMLVYSGPGPLEPLEKSRWMAAEGLKAHLETLEGLTVKDFIPEFVTEAQISFTYAGGNFLADNGYQYWEVHGDGGASAQGISRLKAHLERFFA